MKYYVFNSVFNIILLPMERYLSTAFCRAPVLVWLLCTTMTNIWGSLIKYRLLFIYSFRSFRQLLSCFTAFCKAEVYWLKETESREKSAHFLKTRWKEKSEGTGATAFLFSAHLQRTTSSTRTHLFDPNIAPTSIVTNCQRVILQIRLRHRELIASLRPFWSKSWFSERLTRLTKL